METIIVKHIYGEPFRIELSNDGWSAVACAVDYYDGTSPMPFLGLGRDYEIAVRDLVSNIRWSDLGAELRRDFHARITARGEQYKAIEKHLDRFGVPGSITRLKEIARLDLGKRSDAARRVIAKRIRRMMAE